MKQATRQVARHALSSVLAYVRMLAVMAAILQADLAGPVRLVRRVLLVMDFTQAIHRPAPPTRT